jgi:hypothetical protein
MIPAHIAPDRQAGAAAIIADSHLFQDVAAPRSLPLAAKIYGLSRQGDLRERHKSMPPRDNAFHARVGLGMIIAKSARIS